MRRHPPRANLFSAKLAFLLIELLISSLVFLLLPLLPLLMIILVLPDFASASLTVPFGTIHTVVAAYVNLRYARPVPVRPPGRPRRPVRRN